MHFKFRVLIDTLKYCLHDRLSLKNMNVFRVTRRLQILGNRLSDRLRDGHLNLAHGPKTKK